MQEDLTVARGQVHLCRPRRDRGHARAISCESLGAGAFFRRAAQRLTGVPLLSSGDRAAAWVHGGERIDDRFLDGVHANSESMTDE